MRYFKPELLLRSRSRDDDVAAAAAQEWESAIGAYRARLETIRSKMPKAVRSILSRVTLHDAKVLTLNNYHWKRQNWFNVQMKLEDIPPEPGNVLEITYRLVEGSSGVRFTKHSQVSNADSSPGWVLYDEFDWDEQQDFFTHSLLLTRYELEVRFHKLQVRRMSEVLLSRVGA